jgi:hypothetical protein
MKTSRFKIFLVTSFTFALIFANVFAGKEEYSKIIKKDFSVNGRTALEIANKYGDIHIQNWDQNSFSIEVKITVDTRDKKQADDLLDMLTVIFTQEGDQITANTKISDDFGNAKSWFGNNNGKKFSIDYTVNMPKNNTLKINNKYGNIFINEMNGFVDIDLKYGDMNINKLSRSDVRPMNQIVMAYSKLNIVECNWLKLQASYSKVNIDKSKALILISKYSKGNLGNTSSLVGDNSYDSYQIGNLSNLVIDGKYSNFQITSLVKKLDLNIKYSDLKIYQIPRSFESIEINNQYGKVNLGIDPGASYYLDGFAKYTTIDYPTENARLNKISENVKMTLKGTIGDNPKSTVKINTEYGGVSLVK